MPTTTPRRIIVTGATGKQGSALISSLLTLSPQSPSPHPLEIFAVTRNPTSRPALALAHSHPCITLIRGDFAAPASIFAQVPNPWGLFSVTNPLNAAREEVQGKAMTSAALSAGVKHIVFSATDRGADAEKDPTRVPHFASKFAIEKDLAAQCGLRGATWTVLRPVAFFENMGPGFLGRAFVAMWRVGGEESVIKFVSARDVGRVGAEALLSVGAGEERYVDRAVALSGDGISLAEARRAFLEEVGSEMPEAFGVVGKGLRWALREQLGIMFEWFEEEGFGVDVKGCRAEHPFLKDFRTWLRTESAWKKE